MIDTCNSRLSKQMPNKPKKITGTLNAKFISRGNHAHKQLSETESELNKSHEIID